MKNSKSQINLKSRHPKNPTGEAAFRHDASFLRFCDLMFRDLFGIWNFGIWNFEPEASQ